MVETRRESGTTARISSDVTDIGGEADTNKDIKYETGGRTGKEKGDGVEGTA